MKSAIDSWSARTVSTILGIKRGAEEAMDQWWRRFHRAGHEILKKRGHSPSNMVEKLIHRWAGHVARLPVNHWMAAVVRARAVQYWPHGQVDRSPPEEVQNLPVGRSAVQMAQ